MEDVCDQSRSFSPGVDIARNVPPPPPSPDSDRSNADDGTNLSLMVPDPPHGKKQHREEGVSKFR